MQNKAHKIYLFLIIVILSLFAVWCAIFIYKTSFLIDGVRYYSLFDDAMISMKYAWNFSRGNGLVWNRFDNVEGYTNPMWVFIMATFNFIFEDKLAVLFIQILGVFILLGIIYSTSKLLFEINFTDKKYKYLHLLFTILLLVSYYPMLYWTLMGMETGLLTLLIILSFLNAVKYIKTENLQSIALLTVFSILAYFTRPDSIYIAIVIYGFILSVIKTKKNYIAKFITIYILFITAHIIFRISYYGDLVPNTVILKVFGFPFFERIQNGWTFTKLYTAENFILIFITLFSVLYNSSRIKVLLFSVVATTYFYQIYVGGDPWYYWRFFVPVTPMIFIISSAELINIAKKISEYVIFKHANSNYLLIPFCLTILSVIFLTTNERFLNQIFFVNQPYQVEYNQINVNYALKLKEITNETATIGVIWAGTVPYYSQRDGIDFLGKSDRYISSLKPDLKWSDTEFGMKTFPGHNKYDLEYSIIKLKPDVIERADWGSQSVYNNPNFNYEVFAYKGVEFLVKKDSLNINWQLIK